MFIDDLAGKEIDFEIIFKFLIYYTPKLIPLILPLTVLIASIMTYGNFSERYEFAAMKSAGFSLIRSMRSLVILNIFLCFITFFTTNNLMPYAEFKSFNLRKNLAKVKPALAISEGVFNNVGAINIKVEKKYGVDNSKFENVIIHKSNNNNDNNMVIKASHGELLSEKNSDIVKIVLNDGNRYEEISADNPNSKEYKPQTKIYFKEHVIYINLKEFNNVDFSDEKYNNTFKMQNITQLSYSIDSLEKRIKNQYNNYSSNFYKRTGIYNFQTNYANRKSYSSTKTLPEILNDFDKPTLLQVLNSMDNNIQNQISSLKSQRVNFFNKEKLINLHKSSLYDKYSISLSAIILFFVGAPLGAIIRKGGFGYPIVVAFLMFISYHFLGTFTRKAAEDGSIDPLIGSWIPNLTMLLIGIYLISRASSDKSLINLDSKIEELKLYLKKIKFTK